MGAGQTNQMYLGVPTEASNCELGTQTKGCDIRFHRRWNEICFSAAHLTEPVLARMRLRLAQCSAAATLRTCCLLLRVVRVVRGGRAERGENASLVVAGCWVEKLNIWITYYRASELRVRTQLWLLFCFCCLPRSPSLSLPTVQPHPQPYKRTIICLYAVI